MDSENRREEVKVWQRDMYEVRERERENRTEINRTERYA